MDRDEVLRVCEEMETGFHLAQRTDGNVSADYFADFAARLRAAVGGGWLPADQFPALTIRDDKPCEVNGRSIPPITYSEDVLVLLDNDSVGIDSAAKFDDRTVAFWRIYFDRVKAWQPLPPPPKKAKS